MTLNVIKSLSSWWPTSWSSQPVRNQGSEESGDIEMGNLDSTDVGYENPQPDFLTLNNSDPNRRAEQESTPLANQHRIQPGRVSDVPEANQEAARGADLQQDNAVVRSCRKPVYVRGKLTVYINGSDAERLQNNPSQETSSRPRGSEAQGHMIVEMVKMLPEGYQAAMAHFLILVVIFAILGFALVVDVRAIKYYQHALKAPADAEELLRKEITDIPGMKLPGMGKLHKRADSGTEQCHFSEGPLYKDFNQTFNVSSNNDYVNATVNGNYAHNRPIYQFVEYKFTDDSGVDHFYISGPPVKVGYADIDGVLHGYNVNPTSNVVKRYVNGVAYAFWEQPSQRGV